MGKKKIGHGLSEYINHLPQPTVSGEAAGNGDRERTPAQERKKLKAARDARQLVLVLGAGVSKSFELPDWNSLIQRLLVSFTREGDAEAIREFGPALRDVIGAFAPSPLIASRWLKLLLRQRMSTEPFDSVVHRVIYEKFKSDRHEDPLFVTIRRLCTATRVDQPLDSVITYNYDDVLERYLAAKGIEFKSIYEGHLSVERDKLPIYHVHGYLPYGSNSFYGSGITLSEDAYHHHYSDVYNWANLIQIEKFTHSNCLFIGVSLTDPNLRRLLDIAGGCRPTLSTPHVLIKRRRKAEEVRERIKQFRAAQQVSEETAVPPDNVSEKDASRLAEWLDEVEITDAASLGATILWVDHYDDIPRFLRDL